ncbi:hypothetical protein GWO43_12715 [candidate division KSB1 bacterium]|nr:hypothetical protein [candidate division KSB1 bacterium]NIS24814.1 hypothetical protein [candidate division KSB1 bacterium]NIT71721.1 hypothetical protein [candidate division KSB1 bacterium]NIX71401.1 hypothetical protein [candidate division KSB1 bacterium]
MNQISGVNAVDIPAEWEKLDASELSGTLMVVGAPDVGKTTFARYLFKRLDAGKSRRGYLDGDPGQSSLGPPCTMSLTAAKDENDAFPPAGETWRYFVGSVSPTGHMLPVLTGAARLVAAAKEAAISTIVYDTNGFVDPGLGGFYLKMAEIDLLKPQVIFAIQRQQELESLLIPLRRSKRTHVIDLPMSPDAQRRERPFRQEYRAQSFARYFQSSAFLRINWRSFVIFPTPHFMLHQLVALEDARGFTLGLGIVEEIDRIFSQVYLRTPLHSLDEVDAIRVGDVAVDPETFRDRRLNRKS